MIFNTHGSQCYLKKEEVIEIDGFYDRFLNWVSEEFDLYLKGNESGVLKVYYPNGWFTIGSFVNNNQEFCIKIQVQGKSKRACKILMERILKIYNHLVQFYGVKSESIS